MTDRMMQQPLMDRSEKPSSYAMGLARRRAPRIKMILAFGGIYVIWGTTYLAIRFAIETIPPFLMMAGRYFVAGSTVILLARARGAKSANSAHWKSAMIVGGLLFLGGNGPLVWAEQRVPSGLAALLLSTVPLWMVVLDWLLHRGIHLGPRLIAGLVMGLAGIGLLVGPGQVLGGNSVDLVDGAVLVAGALSWAAGSLYSRRLESSGSTMMSAGMEMASGACFLLIAALLTGEAKGFSLAKVSARSWISLAYLIVFGAIIGFFCYRWLLGATSPARVATYAYVNPLIAVILGWAVAAEPLSLRTVLSGAIIISSVALIISHPLRPQPPGAPRSGEEIEECPAPAV
ncbi:MAG TPA: EamA family transporter [Terriglobia bacterium]|nr:EamA family transporter [Terriglobia bacterium]